MHSVSGDCKTLNVHHFGRDGVINWTQTAQVSLPARASTIIKHCGRTFVRLDDKEEFSTVLDHSVYEVVENGVHVRETKL
jgi:hypothetical protein